MTAPDPAWVEAFWEAAAPIMPKSMTDAIEAGIAAVEPLIRADVIREVALDTAAGIVDPGLRAALTDEICEQIAAQIEANCDIYAPDHTGCCCDDAAAIARGES